MKRVPGILLLLLLVFTACTDSYEQRLQQLHQLQADNRADSLMTRDTLALQLVDYFDCHGTPNDRLLAYYLLGRTYADLGQTPQALETYRTAATKADTTAADCDFAILSRVHAQMAELFYGQLLGRNMLAEIQRAVGYAYRGNDTLMAVNCLARQAEAYELLNEPDSALAILSAVSRDYRTIGLPDYAAALGCSMANLYLQKGNISLAGLCLDDYQFNAGLMMDDGNIETGREVYYYIKGMYFVACQQPDSASYYFRKVLSSTSDLESVASAYKGLRALYEMTKETDSLVKYSRLSDSIANIAHQELEMQTTLHTNAQYDYTQSQDLAKSKVKEASIMRKWLLFIFLLFLLFSLIGIPVFFHYRMKIHQYSLEKRLCNAPITLSFNQLLKSNPYKVPSFEQWKELRTMIETEIPLFYNTLNTNVSLSDMEYDVCLLVRVGFTPSNIAKLKQCVPSYITKIRAKLDKQVAGGNGSAENFDEYVKGIV